jgi:homoserine acetyltransferase
MSNSQDYDTYQLGDFKLQSGGKIPDAFIAYKTLGDPKSPAIIYPSWYSGRKYISSLSFKHQLLNSLISTQ